VIDLATGPVAAAVAAATALCRGVLQGRNFPVALVSLLIVLAVGRG
jgi:hypothetical protein